MMLCNRPDCSACCGMRRRLQVQFWLTIVAYTLAARRVLYTNLVSDAVHLNAEAQILAPQVPS